MSTEHNVNFIAFSNIYNVEYTINMYRKIKNYFLPMGRKECEQVTSFKVFVTIAWMPCWLYQQQKQHETTWKETKRKRQIEDREKKTNNKTLFRSYIFKVANQQNGQLHSSIDQYACSQFVKQCGGTSRHPGIPYQLISISCNSAAIFTTTNLFAQQSFNKYTVYYFWTVQTKRKMAIRNIPKRWNDKNIE